MGAGEMWQYKAHSLKTGGKDKKKTDMNNQFEKTGCHLNNILFLYIYIILMKEACLDIK